MHRRHVAPFAVALAFSLFATGCGKKKEEAPAAAEAAKAGAEAAGKVAEGAAAAAAEVVAKVEPPPADVKLEVGDKVVAWTSIKSISAAFDAIEAVAGKLGLAPPGASLRNAAYDDLTKTLSGIGITGHEWLDKNGAVHVLFQDADPNQPQNGVVVMLPVTDKAKALDALVMAKKGAEASGHEAMMPLGRQNAYIDFVGKHLVLTADPARFAAVKAVAGRIAALDVPALVYVGAAVKDAAAQHKEEIEAMLGQLELMAKNSKEPGSAASMAYYATTLREWLASIDRIEVLLDANVDDVQLSLRMQPTAGSKLARQMGANKGRDASALAASLPANAYLTAIGSLDPKANADQIDESLKLLAEVLRLDDKAVEELKGDFRSAIEKQTGDSAFALYPDGDAALGLMAFAKATDPEAALKLFKKIGSMLMLKAVEAEEARAAARDPKAGSNPQLAIVKKSLAEQKVEPMITAFGPIAKEAGVTVTANATKADDTNCEVVDFAFDWAKISASSGGDSEIEIAKRTIGDRMAIALCTGKDRIVATIGPSAFEQGRRAAQGKVGGLSEAPVYKAAAAASVSHPLWLAYINTGAAVAAFSKAFPQGTQLGLPADRAVTIGCNHRERSYACELDVPVTLVGALQKLGMRGGRGAPPPAMP